MTVGAVAALLHLPKAVQWAKLEPLLGRFWALGLIFDIPKCFLTFALTPVDESGATAG